MPATSDLQDERLVDLLDEALCELRSGRPLDTMAWHERHPELGHEGASLLATLVRFATSVEDWHAALPLPRKSRSTAGTTDTQQSSLPEAIGRYVVYSQIGAGAMGTVYRAHDPQLDRLVAVKVPKMDKVSQDKAKFTERFLREARHAASVRHPHICPIYDAGQHDGQPYVVMAYVEGEPLDTRLSRIERFDDVRQAVRLAIQVAEALAAVHDHQIIHRDLKPANILLDRSGQALLTDFGLAREVETDTKLTMDGIVVGTPSYMSPEQASGQNSGLGPAADIYSLGIVLYEMLTGKLPFRGSVCDVLRKIVVEPPPSPVEHRPGLDPRLAELVLKAIAKNHVERFQSAENFAWALQGWLDSAVANPTPDRVPGARSTEATTPQTAAVPRAASVAKTGRSWRRRYLAKGIMAAALFIAAGAGFYGWSHHHSLQHESLISDANPAISSTQTSPGTPADGHTGVPLAGRLKIRFIGKPQSAAHKATASGPREGDDAPLPNGHKVQLQVTLSRPAHVYLFWIDSNGTTGPIYPWDFGHSEELWDAPWVPDSEVPANFIRRPQDPRKGFRAGGKPGMQHVVLLARSAPVDSPKELRSIFSGLPASPLDQVSPAARYFDWSPGQVTCSGRVRGLVAGVEDDTGEPDEEPPTPEFDESDVPVLAMLKDRLRTYDFELIKVWRFAQVEK
jgi:serine/threonine protein kinase